MKICFNYNPYLYFESYKNVLNNVRIHYPESDIFIYFDEFRDDKKKYEEVAHEHNCKFNIRKDEFFYIQQDLGVQNAIPRTYEWLMRLKHTCENTDADWLLLLEDDVLIKNKIENWPEADVGTCRSYFRPGGGAIFKVESFLKVIKNYDLEKLKNIALDMMWMHGDVMLEKLFLLNGITFQEWVELAEPNHRDEINHSVFHGYKELHKLK